MTDLFDWAYDQYTKEPDIHMTKLLISPGHMEPMRKEQYELFDDKSFLVLPRDDKAFSEKAKKNLQQIMPRARVVNVKGGHVATPAKTGEYTKATREFMEERIG